jgi:hypothetical protein
MPSNTNLPTTENSEAIPSYQSLQEIILAVRAVLLARGSYSEATHSDTSVVLNEDELATRWGLSKKALQRWRALGQGPDYLKLGRRVVFPFKAILDFEREALRISGKTGGSHDSVR